MRQQENGGGPGPGLGSGVLRTQFQARVLILTVCAAGIGGTFQYGYNLTIINAPTMHIQKFVNQTWLERTGLGLEVKMVTLIWSFIVSVYPLGGFIGALLAGPMAIKLGRKKSLLLNNLFVLIAALLSGFSRRAKSFEMIVLGRVFAGINSALQRLRGNRDLNQRDGGDVSGTGCHQGKRAKRLWELFREPSLRWQLITIIVLSSAMQLCGNDSMYFYASYVFQEAGIPYEKIQYAVIGTGCCEFLTSVTCSLFIERIGRKALVLGGYSLMSVWAIVFMVALSQQDRISWMPYLSMACIFAYILSFGIGPAGVTGLLPTELFDQMSRPAAYMICGSLIWLMLSLVGLLFPFIMAGLGHFCFVPFFAVCVCTSVYVGFFLPETKGKSVMEVTEEFNKRNLKALTHDQPWKGPAEIKCTML
ncbi:solute carrier family 2, facilitated glucose transporter member 11 isoform X3 [Microcaecilia unicolor]|uniref:Solute carrier family 2, facilitated glucose transporter member 11 isoform X3 n=1 Tax=Microcaecilia unicolor TaxID=1415580 RepID=A0A6P7ZNT0_9AMPH|nr:solute carrier family 2, facilitated glucose transporter member 11 isoform X3 [Microcaecilia unicolor]